MNRLVDQLNQPISIIAATILPVDSIRNPAIAWKGIKSATAVYVVFRRIQPSGKGSMDVFHEMSILHLNGEKDWGEMRSSLEQLGHLYDEHDDRNCTRVAHGLILDPSFQ